MRRPILLDTHAAIWATSRGQLSPEAEAEIEAVWRDRSAIYVSPISAWEVGLLVARHRITLPMTPAAWFESLIGAGLRWASLTPEVLIDSSFLPGEIHGDPADRILVATARAFGCRLMTRDRALLGYAQSGHLQAVAC